MPAPRIAVITAYHRESRPLLLRCLQSVAAQTVPCTHFMISDGYPSVLLADWPARHIQLGVEHADFGDTPRAIGSLLAIAEGYDAIVYLDADNYYLPGHLAGLLAAWEGQGRQLDVITTRRFFLYPDGRPMPLADTTDPWQMVDTNCLFLTGAARDIAPLWAQMPANFHVFGDRVIWLALKARGLRMAHLPQATVGYTSNWKSQYLALGEIPPPDAKDIDEATGQAARWWHTLAQPERERYLALLGFDPRAAGLSLPVATSSTRYQPY